jgi:hypothetical protein
MSVSQASWLIETFRGTRFTLSRDELLTLPEFVLLSLFPNGLFPEGHVGTTDHDAVDVDVSWVGVCVQYAVYHDLSSFI